MAPCRALAGIGIPHAIFNMPNVQDITLLETFRRWRRSRIGTGGRNGKNERPRGIQERNPQEHTRQAAGYSSSRECGIKCRGRNILYRRLRQMKESSHAELA
jgi:hypothetical protein